MDDIRLDKYLWAVRIFKTRSDAADAIRTNKVTVNDAYAKPSREVRIGDRTAVRQTSEPRGPRSAAAHEKTPDSPAGIRRCPIPERRPVTEACPR